MTNETIENSNPNFSSPKLTPLMKQYWEIKSLHQDKVLLFRMGDFYEMFDEDARTAAPILNITLTQRNKKAQDQMPMCGVPYHSIGNQINKLLASGRKVAICDQIEDPKMAQGIVKRAVTRILTPGMVYDPDTLDETKSQYIACQDEDTLSFFESSTGEAFYIDLKMDPQTQRGAQLQHWFTLMNAVEFVQAEKNIFSELHSDIVLSIHSDIYPQIESLKTDQGQDLPLSMKRLLSYAFYLGGDGVLRSINGIEKKQIHHRMLLAQSVFKHLEIFENNKGETQPTFFSSINRALTSAGKRLLRSMVLSPLTDQSKIEERLDQIEFWRNQFPELKKVRMGLAHVGDLERRFIKLTATQANGRDILSLASSVEHGLQALQLASIIQGKEFQFQELISLVAEIEKTVVAEPPLSNKQGHIIQKGVHDTLDEYILLTTQGHQILAELEQKEKELTGISSLKIRYNNVFGYYIEVTNTYKNKVPDRYKRKQTLAQAERFYTEELLELERKILTAQSKRFELEFEIFEKLKKKIISYSAALHQFADQVSRLDVESSLAWLSLEEKYCRPVFTTKKEIIIQGSRHPVLDQTLQARFVANDLLMKDFTSMLLTGPNMGGKSTFMRQVALICLMAQMGCYVPATAAVLPLFDQISTRIGASDQLSEGLSTFMVEMKETAELLASATSRSLIILDEIGRGTATYDGLSLAQGILEHLLENISPFTFFATHYHEMTLLEKDFKNLRNFHMGVTEQAGNLKFSYLLNPGPALKSYGISVAKLAGLPASLLKRAGVILKNLEKQNNFGIKSDGSRQQISLLDWVESSAVEIENATQKSNDLTSEEKRISEEKIAILQSLKFFDVNQKTPLQTLNFVVEIQGKINQLDS